MANNLSTRKLFSIAILIFSISTHPSFAKWVFISDGYLGSVYLDFETLEKKEKNVSIWQLQNFYRKDLNGVHSRRLLIEVDCNKDIRRVVYLSAHSELMGGGDVKFINPTVGKWEQPSPKSLGEKLLKSVCKKEFKF